MAQISFRRQHVVKGNIEVLTGLRIGAGREQIEIGGLDNPVIKHPHTGHPYIPGSSIKGRLRCLMEWAFDVVAQELSLNSRSVGVFGSGANVRYEDHPILRIFGHASEEPMVGPTRLVVRDAPLNQKWLSEVLERGLPLTEEKQEVTIDRIQGKAAGMGPRTMERVPAGAIFDFEMIFREFSVNGDKGEEDRKCLRHLIQGLKLLEQDALGGSGSRGYGKIKFTNLTLNNHDIQSHFDKIVTFDPENPPAIPEEYFRA